MENVTSVQLYVPDTAVLVTRFMTEAGVGEVIDFMPVDASTTVSGERRLVRLIRCVRGEMTFDVEVAPRFDYGRESVKAEWNENGAVFRGSSTAMTICLVRNP